MRCVVVGFLGQVYQVHGLANEIFNVLSTPTLQLNAFFMFLGAGEAMTTGQQVDVEAQASPLAPLPHTAAWAHSGTYLGSIGLQAGLHTLIVNPGRYATGFRSVVIDGRVVTTAGVVTQDAADGLSIALIGAHVVEVRTRELSFRIVNSDGFVNLEAATLSRSVSPSAIDGILGQSADPTRYFPAYSASEQASSDVKSDFQKHMILDYLILDRDLTSTEFAANKFRKPAEQTQQPSALEVLAKALSPQRESSEG